MSVLGIVFIKDGVIMSSDSRLTATRTIEGTQQTRRADRLPKTFLLGEINVGISYCGNARVEGELFHDFIEDFVNKNVNKNDTVCTVVQKLISVTDRKDTHFIVGGYLNEIQYVYHIYNDILKRINVDDDDNIIYSTFTLGGDGFPKKYYIENIQGKYSIDELDLKNGITLAENFVVTGIQNAESCGGSINTLVLQKDAAYWHECHFFDGTIEIK